MSDLGFLSDRGLRALEELIERIVDERLAVAARRSDPELLTPDEAAALLQAKRQRVYDLCSEGRLPRHKDGSRLLVSRADLDAYLDNSR